MNGPAASPPGRWARQRDRWAGGLLALIGLLVVADGQALGIGSLAEIGPGLLPVVLGAVLVLLGLAIVLTAAPGPEEVGHERVMPPDWRGIGAIVAGLLLFLVLGQHGGLVPATFACVLVSALGDRQASWRGALALATAMTLVAVALFHFALGVQFPLLRF